MSSGFAALLKMSQDQTAQSEKVIESQIAAHRVQLEKKRKEQEAKDRKEREIEAKLRAKRLEDQQKEEERKLKRAQEEEMRAKELAKREAQMRDSLRFGPKKASANGSSKVKRTSNNESDDDLGSQALTREEKRERRLAAQLRRKATSTTSRRGRNGGHRLTSLPDGRTVRRLPGGAVDVTVVSRLADPNADSQLQLGELANRSARERLAAMPAILTKLNTVKRDTRTTDDVYTERQKNKQKVLAGEDAKSFNDWFGKKKKEAEASSKITSQATSQQSVPSRLPSTSPAGSATPSLSPGPSPKQKHAALALSARSLPSVAKPNNAKPSAGSSTHRQVPASKPVKAKRPMSPSLSPPPAKRRAIAAVASSKPALQHSSSRRPPARKKSWDSEEEDYPEVSKLIQDMFRRDRGPYRGDIDDGDDSDAMEAGVDEVLDEEDKSTRIAKKEDAAALREEMERERQKKLRKQAKLGRHA